MAFQNLMRRLSDEDCKDLHFHVKSIPEQAATANELVLMQELAHEIKIRKDRPPDPWVKRWLK